MRIFQHRHLQAHKGLPLVSSSGVGSPPLTLWQGCRRYRKNLKRLDLVTPSQPLFCEMPEIEKSAVDLEAHLDVCQSVAGFTAFLIIPPGGAP